VAVNDAERMNRTQSATKLLQYRERLLRGEGPPVANELSQRSALQPLHDEVGPAVVALAKLVDLDHIRMANPADETGLLLEAGDGTRSSEVFVQHLDCDRALQHQMMRAIDRAEASRGDEVLHDIVADLGAGSELRPIEVLVPLTLRHRRS